MLTKREKKLLKRMIKAGERAGERLDSFLKHISLGGIKKC